MAHRRVDSRGTLARGQCASALRRASLALCLSLALARPALADVVKLKNGELIKCKVIKEMKDLIKVRMPHRGRIVTTFLNRGLIESISRSADVENRKLFQDGGVHNPGRAYEPVYYGGVASAPKAATGAGPGRPMAAKGKAKGGTTTKKRGVDARRERSAARSKERSGRFGERASKGSKGGAATSPSSPAAPTTSESTGTTVGASGGGTGTSVSVGQ